MQMKFLKKIMLVSLTSLPLVSIAAVSSTDGETQLNAKIIQISADKQVLMEKLAKLSFFTADFSQKILSDSGQLLQQGAGKPRINKPNLVHLQNNEPDETFIISDGETLWFYDPFIEQATAYDLAKSIHNTPILLLTSNDESLWQQYSVQKTAESFVISPLNENSQIKSLTVSFTEVGQQEQLSEFSFVDATGQVSSILLEKFDANVKPAQSLFDFSLPQGVRLEDKR